MSHDSSLVDDDKTCFTITLTPVPGYNIPCSVRLRKLLKDALRRYGLRCVTLREAATPTDEGGAQ